MPESQNNITVPSYVLLAKCIDLVSTLTNYSETTNLTFRTKTGIEFVHVNGNQHYPILVNENLYKFLQTIWTFGTVLSIVFVSVVCLSWLNHFCRWFCRDRTFRPTISREHAETNQHHPPLSSTVRRLPSELASIVPNPVRIKSSFIDRYLHQPVLTQDTHFVIKAFNCGNTIAATGCFLEITPKKHCININCSPEHCNLQHIFYLYIPSMETFPSQIQQILPTSTTPISHKTTVIGSTKTGLLSSM